jgi:hypothetical protein
MVKAPGAVPIRQKRGFLGLPVATVDTSRFSKWQPFKNHRSESSLREFSHVGWKYPPTPCRNTFVGNWSNPTMKAIPDPSLKKNSRNSASRRRSVKSRVKSVRRTLDQTKERDVTNTAGLLAPSCDGSLLFGTWRGVGFPAAAGGG